MCTALDNPINVYMIDDHKVEFVQCSDLTWSPYCSAGCPSRCEFPFLSAEHTHFLFLSELMDLFVAGRDQSGANKPNDLAQGHSLLQPSIINHQSSTINHQPSIINHQMIRRVTNDVLVAALQSCQKQTEWMPLRRAWTRKTCRDWGIRRRPLWRTSWVDEDKQHLVGLLLVLIGVVALQMHSAFPG